MPALTTSSSASSVSSIGVVVVEAVDLVEVDVVHAEPPQRVVDGVHDVLARQAALVGVVAHRVVDLGGDDHLVARGAEILQRPAGDLLAGAARVHVGGVEEVDPGLERRARRRAALLVLVEHPVAPLAGAVGHHAEAEPRHLEAGGAEIDVFHRGFSVGMMREVPSLYLSTPG